MYIVPKNLYETADTVKTMNPYHLQSPIVTDKNSGTGHTIDAYIHETATQLTQAQK